MCEKPFKSFFFHVSAGAKKRFFAELLSFIIEFMYGCKKNKVYVGLVLVPVPGPSVSTRDLVFLLAWSADELAKLGTRCIGKRGTATEGGLDKD